VRRYRPAWMLPVPNPALAARHQDFWLEKVWSDALEFFEAPSLSVRSEADPRSHHGSTAFPADPDDGDEIRSSAPHSSRASCRNLTEMMATADDPYWAGSPVGMAALLPCGASSLVSCPGTTLVCHRSTSENDRLGRTLTDCVEPYVDRSAEVASRPEWLLCPLWLDQARIEGAPRNWPFGRRRLSNRPRNRQRKHGGRATCCLPGLRRLPVGRQTLRRSTGEAAQTLHSDSRPRGSFRQTARRRSPPASLQPSSDAQPSAATA
jgi:hypothetical protein